MICMLCIIIALLGSGLIISSNSNSALKRNIEILESEIEWLHDYIDSMKKEE